MELVLKFQSWLVSSNPALLPLLATVYSLMSSLHCVVMCAPLLPRPKDRKKYFFYRALSYTFAGGLFGAFGDLLRESLEYKIGSALAFIVFSFATLAIFGFNLIRWRSNSLQARVNLSQRTLALRGLLSVFIPCHVLYFFFSLAIVSSSAFGGAIILFGHAIATMPALAYSGKWFRRQSEKLKLGKKVAHYLIIFLTAINLVYFGSRLFHSEEVSKSKVLFCL